MTIPPTAVERAATAATIGDRYHRNIEAQKVVHDEMETIDAAMWEAFFNRMVEVEDLANAMGIRPQTVYRHMKKARERFAAPS